MTILDLIMMQPLHLPFDTDIDNQSIPPSVQAFLALGDKFVAPGTLPNVEQLDEAISKFGRKVRLKAFFMDKDDSSRESTGAILPRRRVGSRFDPFKGVTKHTSSCSTGWRHFVKTSAASAECRLASRMLFAKQCSG